MVITGKWKNNKPHVWCICLCIILQLRQARYICRHDL